MNVNRKTVARKLKVFGPLMLDKLRIENADLKFDEIQFDDLETIEHTKMKPVSITLAVSKGRRILGFRAGSMPAKGLLAIKSIKKYGRRRDERGELRRELFSELSPLVNPGALIKSDSNPYYVSDVKKFFPDCIHEQCIGQRGSTTGQGELKRVRFDPIFALNHTCAMFRGNVSALIRKTWCTSKKIENLTYHLAIYAVSHNRNLKS